MNPEPDPHGSPIKSSPTADQMTEPASNAEPAPSISPSITIDDEKYVLVRGRKRPKWAYASLVSVIGGLISLFTLTDYALFGLTLPVVSKAIDIPTVLSLRLASIISAAVLVSGFICGPLADRFGRVRVLRWWMVVAGLFSAGTGLVTNAWQFLATRLVASTTIHTQVITTAMVSEEAPPRRRGLALGVMQGISQLSATVVGLLAAVLLPTHWRGLFFVFLIPVAILFALSYLLRETPQSVAQRNERIAARKAGVKPQFEYRQLFATRRMTRQTIACWLFYPLVQCGNIGFATVGPTYLTGPGGLHIQQVAIITSISGVAAIVVQLISGALCDFISPKWLACGCIALTGTTYMFFSRTDAGFAYYFITALLYYIFAQAIFGALPRYVTGSFPAQVRATAFGSTHAFADSVPALIFPLISAALIATDHPGTIWIIGGILVLAGGVVLAFGGINLRRDEMIETSTVAVTT